MTPIVNQVVPQGSLDAIAEVLPGDVGVFVITLVVVWYVIKDVIAVIRRGYASSDKSEKDKSDKEMHKDMLKLLRDNSTTLAVVKSMLISLRSNRR